MKVTILFSYTEQVIPPRCRNPRLVLKHDGRFEVNILELSPADAPVALKVRKSDTRADGKEMVDVLPYRWAFGKLWTNVRLFNCSRSSFVSGQSDWDYRRPPALMDLRSETDARTNGYRFNLCLRDIHSKQDIQEQITAWAEDHLILKGLPGIWCTAEEPRYVVMTFGLGSNHGGTALMLDAGYNSNISKDRYFNALDYAKAKAEATRVAKQRGDTKSLPISSAHGKIQVLMPEAIRCAPQKEAGDGDPFLNKVNAITDSVPHPLVAGLLVMNEAVRAVR